MDQYRKQVQMLNAPTIGSILADFAQEGGPVRFADNQRITIAGVVTSSKTKTTKNNSLMAYVTVEDDTGSMELLCFSKTLDLCGAYLKENQAVMVRGKLSVRDEKAPQIMCDSAYPLATVSGGVPPEKTEAPSDQLEKGEVLYLKFPSIDSPELKHLKLVFTMFPGDTPVKMVMADTRKVYGTQILLHRALLKEAREVLGADHVVIK